VEIVILDKIKFTEIGLYKFIINNLSIKYIKIIVLNYLLVT